MKSMKSLVVISLFLMLGLVIVFRKDVKNRAHQVIIRRRNRTSDLSTSQIAQEISQLEKLLAKQEDQRGNEEPGRDQSKNGAPRESESPRTEKKQQPPQQTTFVPTKPAKVCGKGRKLVGNLFVNKEKASWETLKKENHVVKEGGQFSPADCSPKVKTAIIIPYRDREEHLKVFLRQLHPMLQRQDLYYQVFVIEQADKSTFNRGKLMNVGYQEAMKFADFNCFVFHDVDLIPENDYNYYGCSKSPMHLSVAVDKFYYKLLYSTLFGGVEMFSKEDFIKINGFSNVFWGWGAEDDNLYQRLGRNGLTLKRPAIEKARYTMIKHKEAPKDDTRFKTLNEAIGYADKDGLNSLQYEVTDTVKHPCYTKISVDLHKEKDRKFKRR